MRNFALIGAAGFIAPRHFKAIKETGNNLVAAMDKFDCVGILDSFFPDADFFTEFERFDRHIDKLRRNGTHVDYVTICSPNYLHDSHIRFALRHHANAICEKPLVLNPWNIDALADIERETGKRVHTILQLRLHPAIIRLKNQVASDNSNKPFDVQLKYITSRGRWYRHSWKGEEAKSGGIATNIGIHFFDMLLWIFGRLKTVKIERMEPDHASGLIELDRANVRWFLSINAEHLPGEIKIQGKRTFRLLQMNGQEIEFSDGFTDLHTKSYEQIMEGKGFSLMDAKPSIELAQMIRTNR